MRLAMFPLGAVLLPGEVLPLQVFEPRFRRLVLDCLAADAPQFGTVMIERGSEVGGGDERASTGTRALIRLLEPLGGGRFKLQAVGVRRISVLEWLPEDPYPVADVEDWPDVLPGEDDAEAVAARLAQLREQVDRIRTLLLALAPRGRRRLAQPLALNDDPVVAAYQLAAAVGLGPADRFHVLQAPTFANRLDVLAAALDDHEAAVRFRVGSGSQE